MTASSSPRKRNSKACDRCRKQKKKCDGKRPECESCKRSKKKCTWDLSLTRASQSRGRHRYQEKIKQHGEEVKDQQPGPEVSQSDKDDRTAQTLALHRDSINDESTAASRTSLEDLTLHEIRRCGRIYFQEWAPLYPALTESEFEKALNGLYDNTDPIIRDIHVTQIYLVADIAGVSSEGHGLEQQPTYAPRWQEVLDATDLEPSIQVLQCFLLSILCCTKRRDYTRLCPYMDRAICLYKDLFLDKNHKDEKYPRVDLESHKDIFCTLFILDCFSAASLYREMQLKYRDIEPTNLHKTECPDDKASTARHLLQAARILADVLDPEHRTPLKSHDSFSQRMEYLERELGDWYGQLPNRLQLDQDIKSSHPAIMAITYYYILAHIHKPAFHFGVKDEHLPNLMSFRTSCTNIIDLVGRLEKKKLNLPLCLNRNDLVSVCEMAKESEIVPRNAL